MSELKEIRLRLEAIEKRLASTIPHDVLTEREQDILEALGAEKLTGEVIAKKAGYEYDGHFKSLLSSLVKRQHLINERPGYRKRQSGPSKD